MTLRAVFFDMGGTIERFWLTAELRLQATPDLQVLMRAAGLDLGLEDAELCDLVTRGFKRYHGWALDTMQELPAFRIWDEFILCGHSYDTDRLVQAADEFTHFFEARFYHRALRPEVPSVLESIKDLGLKIGMISNTCSLGMVPGKLEEYKIRNYFDPLVLSSVYGRRKPDPAIFHQAAWLARVPTSRCLYIGDRIARDVIGAHKAGFRLAVQIHNDFEHGEADDCDVPDATINSMDELLGIIQDESRKPDRLFQKSFDTPAEPVQAIFFDAGDILYYRENAGSEVKQFLAGLGLDLDKVSKAELRALMVQSHRGQITQEQYREAVLRLCGVTEPEHIQQGKRLLEQEDNAVIIFPGVPETLHSLKENGFLLGVITDTNQQLTVKLKWFERGGFVDVWDSIVSSWETGFSKPAPEIYRMALEQVGVRPEQAVFVGHKSYELEGARAVGMKTVAFNYEKDAVADHYIQNFSDLLVVPFLKLEESQGIMYANGH